MRIGLPLHQLARNLRPPRQLNVREAWLNHERYLGQRIRLSGAVRAFDETGPTPYFTLDDGPARVGLRGESSRLLPLTGHRVRVVGTLSFKPGVGIFLDVESLTPAN